ncbi:MAG: dihydropteroate synthase [Omnitrophica WOR_2 bacterium RIFCSPHIGHO2_02_FULL_52_10]|nr:MAG: dihydropteroate synthase [Omnitrophica WOR_2 bacterium RIFCSPHIGHO2_02_FULL_52_10]
MIEAGPHHLSLGQRTYIQGIVNVTPDSFSNDGCWQGKDSTRRAVRLAQKHIREGADIIDVGGESTRPGAKPVSIREELARVIPVIRVLSGKVEIPISVDTYKPAVAQAALDAGACILNTILGAHPPSRLLKMARNYNAAVVLMHMRGVPRTMQTGIHYHDVIADIINALERSIEKCLEAGIKSDKIIIDPGIGFGKTAGHNLEILNRLKDFKTLGRPLLIGTSRKSFIGAVLNKDVGQRILGTAATVCASILNGAHIVRVHDVKAMRDIALMTDAILNASYS